MNKLAVMAIFSLSAAFVPIQAQTVEVALLESIPPDGAAMTRSSELVIAGALEGLFDTGFIATNSRPRPGDGESFLSYKPGPEEAEGRIDFVIVVLADYAGEALVPACRFRLVRVGDGEELASGSVPAAVAASSSNDDIDKACAAVGAAVSAECGRALRSLSASRRDHGHEEA